MIDNDEVIDVEYVEVVHTLTEDYLSRVRWRMKDGNTILVKDMADSHLRNSVLFLTGFGYQKCVAMESTRLMWLRIFNMEWMRRMAQRKAGPGLIRRQSVY